MQEKTREQTGSLGRTRRGHVVAPALLAALAVGADAQPPDETAGFREWRAPAPVENVAGGCPIEDRRGMTLFTAGGFDGTLDIFVYERDGRQAPFRPRIKIEDAVSREDADDFCPTPVDGKWLFFVSDRPVEGACGGADIYLTRLGSDTAINLGCAPHGPNTAGRELAPSLMLTDNRVYLYFSTNGPSGDQDIFRSRLGWNGRFGAGQPVEELNTLFNDQQPNVARGGREIVFSSDRDGTQDVFTALRTDSKQPWSAIRNLSMALDFPTVDGNETRASLSWDRVRLYYGSGGTIYQARRPVALQND